ncbi:hypothetical protein SY2F82_35750 [Streptomyces sp. Y2F8-2]|nr:hypothetical protein SY2F82_35750 [Streptomyces sp. Y2F8-2]
MSAGATSRAAGYRPGSGEKAGVVLCSATTEPTGLVQTARPGTRNRRRRLLPSSPQANGPSRPSRTAALAGAGISSVGSLAASLAGAPGGVVLAVAVTGLVTVLVQSLIQGAILR